MENEKKCFKCHVIKPIDAFYRHPMMADGHLGKCKECTKSDVHNNYAAKRPFYQAYERSRNQRSERKRARLQYQQNRRREHPEKNRAYELVRYAVRAGKLVRKPCERQPCSQRAQAHHEDYSRPLDVRWLCFKHHREEHGQIVIP